MLFTTVTAHHCTIIFEQGTCHSHYIKCKEYIQSEKEKRTRTRTRLAFPSSCTPCPNGTDIVNFFSFLCNSCSFFFCLIQLPYKKYLSWEDFYYLRDSVYQLKDSIISFSMFLLRKQYPQIGGLRDTLGIIQKPQLFVGDALQIFHSSNHWILVQKTSGRVIIFDSLNSGRIPAHVTLLIKNTMGVMSRLEYARVQQQSDAFLCGVFCIAFAEALCRGCDIQRIRFNERKKRDHLFDCLFIRGTISEFPLVTD